MGEPAPLPESPRLRFRPWREEDIDLALALWGDPKVTALIDARGALGRAEVLEKLSEEIERQRRYGVQYWPIFLKAGGAHVGCCGLRPYDPARRIYELGFHLRAEHWGRGLAAEAARAAARFAFDSLSAGALFAGHHPENAASRRVLARLGFRYTHDERYPATGLMHPSYLLGPGELLGAA